MLSNVFFCFQGLNHAIWSDETLPMCISVLDMLILLIKRKIMKNLRNLVYLMSFPMKAHVDQILGYLNKMNRIRQA